MAVYEVRILSIKGHILTIGVARILSATIVLQEYKFHCAMALEPLKQTCQPSEVSHNDAKHRFRF